MPKSLEESQQRGKSSSARPRRGNERPPGWYEAKGFTLCVGPEATGRALGEPEDRRALPGRPRATLASLRRGNGQPQGTSPLHPRHRLDLRSTYCRGFGGKTKAVGEGKLGWATKRHQTQPRTAGPPPEHVGTAWKETLGFGVSC